MSIFIFGTVVHSPTCKQSGGHPPVLCGCRTLDIPAARDERVLARIRSSPLQRAVADFLYRLDGEVA